MDNATRSAQIRALRFGVEIEFVGVARSVVAKAIAAALGVHRTWPSDSVTMTDGRVWNVVRDGSLSSYTNGGEVVSPILTHADVDMLATVVHAIRSTGATVDKSCGVHVHVDAAAFDGKALARLATLVYAHEPLLVEALGVKSRVENAGGAAHGGYCAYMSDRFVRRLPKTPRTRESVLVAWYGSASARDGAVRERYHQSRYRGLNLHAVQYRGTVEFRYFAGSIHAGEIRANVELCCALAATALHVKAPVIAEKNVVVAATARYDVEALLAQLGLVGDEWETVRFHMTKRLPVPNGSAVPVAARPAAAVSQANYEAATPAPGAIGLRRNTALSGEYFRDLAVAFILTRGPRGARHSEIIAHIVGLHPEMVRMDGVVSGTVRQIMTDLPARRRDVVRGTQRGVYVARRVQGVAA